jgi:long-chain acyl-CoA synthetase
MGEPVPTRSAVAEARTMAGPPFAFPWRSFADFLASRVGDPALADRVFLISCDDDRRLRREWTYRAFGEEVSATVQILRDRLNLRRGDRIATLLFNHDRTVLLYFAAWTLGLVVVPINVEEPAEHRRYILGHSEAEALCCWHELFDEALAMQAGLPHLRHVVAVNDDGFEVRGSGFEGGRQDSLRPEPRTSYLAPRASCLDDLALIVYTSGTTGEPKGVMLTAENLLVDADGIAAWHRFGAVDRLMCVLPIHHVNGTVVTLLTPFYAQGSLVLTRKFKAGVFWRRIHDEGVTCVSVVPTVLEYLLLMNEETGGYDLSRFRGVICGAGPLLKDTAARFETRFGVPIHHGYGLSETTCYACFLPPDLAADARRHWLTGYDCPSVGVPIRHNEMAILDEQGRPVPDGARGEICIRGQTVCRGYFKRPEADAAAFRGGWFRSGDEGFVIRDEKGRPFYFISGRMKELIIRGGVNISPLEIDDVLKTHPAVAFAMAVPFEHRLYGEEIAAYVVPRETAAPPTEAELLDHCRARLPLAKRPKVIVFGSDVPYTATGKPKRLALKSRLAPDLARYRTAHFPDR